MGGLMGYLKRGSQKSLIAGGVSASVLYYVYTELPSKPVLASSIGLGKDIYSSLMMLLELFKPCDHKMRYALLDVQNSSLWLISCTE